MTTAGAPLYALDSRCEFRTSSVLARPATTAALGPPTWAAATWNCSKLFRVAGAAIGPPAGLPLLPVSSHGIPTSAAPSASPRTPITTASEGETPRPAGVDTTGASNRSGRGDISV